MKTQILTSSKHGSFVTEGTRTAIDAPRNRRRGVQVPTHYSNSTSTLTQHANAKSVRSPHSGYMQGQTSENFGSMALSLHNATSHPSQALQYGV